MSPRQYAGLPSEATPCRVDSIVLLFDPDGELGLYILPLCASVSIFRAKLGFLPFTHWMYGFLTPASCSACLLNILPPANNKKLQVDVLRTPVNMASYTPFSSSHFTAAGMFFVSCFCSPMHVRFI